MSSLPESTMLPPWAVATLVGTGGMLVPIFVQYFLGHGRETEQRLKSVELAMQRYDEVLKTIQATDQGQASTIAQVLDLERARIERLGRLEVSQEYLQETLRSSVAAIGAQLADIRDTLHIVLQGRREALPCSHSAPGSLPARS